MFSAQILRTLLSTILVKSVNIAQLLYSLESSQCAQKWRFSAKVAFLDFIVAPKIPWGGQILAGF